MTLFASIFTQDILPIFIVAAVGFLLARVAGASVKTLSTVSFHALSPCLLFDQLVSSRVSVAQSWRVVAFCLVMTAGIGAAARLATVPLRLDRRGLTSFLLVVMFSNSGNYALPVVLFAFGEQALAFASVYFVTSAILVYTLGVFIASSGQGSVRRALGGLVRVPAVYGAAAAVIVLAAGVSVPVAVMRPVSLLSDAAIPVMLLVLGAQLERATWPARPSVVATAVTLSLVVSPLLAFLMSDLLGLAGAARQAAIAEASMPAAVVTTVLALEFDLDAGFATSVVVASTLLSPLTLVALIAYLR